LRGGPAGALLQVRVAALDGSVILPAWKPWRGTASARIWGHRGRSRSAIVVRV